MPNFENPYRFEIGKERQLFVDDWMVAKVEGLKKTLHPPVKYEGNPVLTGDLPFEKDFACLHGTVLKDPIDGLFKAWYLSGGNGIGYAVSEEGIHWRKPLFEIFPIDGKATNIVYRGQYPDLVAEQAWKADGCSVMVDPDDSDPARRYKLFAFEVPVSPEARERFPDGYGYYTATSPDGLHWTVGSPPVLTKRKDDPLMSDANTCMFDPLRNRYIAFTKRHQVWPDGIGDQGVMKRVRGVSFSDDFKNWTRPVTCLLPDDHDARDVEFYRQGGWIYEGMYLGLLEIYHSDYEHPTCPLMRNLQLVSSRDGELWGRAGGRETFIDNGPEGSWDGKMLELNSCGPILVDDELWIYYGGRPYPHESHPELFPWNGPRGAGIGLAKLRRDGFVSYDAADVPGTLLTKAFRFQEGSSLHINADAGQGQIRVEVIAIFERENIPRRQAFWDFGYGDPIQHFSLTEAVPVSGVQPNATVSWKMGQDLSRFAGQWIALRFHVQNASLYSTWIE